MCWGRGNGWGAEPRGRRAKEQVAARMAVGHSDAGQARMAPDEGAIAAVL